MSDLVLAKIDRALIFLAEAKDLQQVKQVIALADAAKVYAKQVDASVETINRASEIRLRAERRLGEMLKESPKNQGAKGIGTSAVPKENHTPPTLAEAGISKKLSSRAQQLAALPVDQFEAVLDVPPGEELHPGRILRELKEAKAAERQKAMVERFQSAPVVDVQDCQIITADFQDMAQDIPDGSIDAIITDPPYPAEFLHLFAPMAKIAARTLKPGGSLLVMCGQSYLPEIIGALNDHLTYQWTFAYMTPGAATTIYQRHVNCSWKPVLWFVKGEYKGRWIQDVLQSKERDKDFHEWGQSESGTAAMVEAVTEPSDIVFDPFVGGGTTAVVAAKLKRRFIGAEIDPEVAQLAQARIHEAIQ